MSRSSSSWTNPAARGGVWSFAGMPSIALPSGLAPDGLPLSLQLVGGALGEARLLAAAAWCEQVLAFREVPRA